MLRELTDIELNAVSAGNCGGHGGGLLGGLLSVGLLLKVKANILGLIGLDATAGAAIDV